ncbi:MAG: glycerate kinase [Betaproteobacteria bacterium]|nr:glycerate kinase [Betaproteobacteria bacterium]
MTAPVVVLAPDSFKGSLDAPAVCAALAAGLRRVWPDAVPRHCPMADGGEGTLDAVLAAAAGAGVRRQRVVRGASGQPVAAGYGVLGTGHDAVAVIEVAQVVAITDPVAMQAGVRDRDTRGIGELLLQLLDEGLRRFMIGLGGSSTNDGGAGLLAALGLDLFDAQRRPVAASPAGLAALAAVDAVRLDPRLAQSSITLMSDVNNPLCGALGATAVFGPQKGVTAAEVAMLDAILGRFAALTEEALGVSAATRPGAGAAGGLGFALQLIGGTFRSGAAVVADLNGLDRALAGADWVLTGEGRSDAQTLLAKAPFVVAQRARAAGVPATLVSGAVDPAALTALGAHFAGAFALAPGPITLADCIARTDALLADRAAELARLFAAIRRSP